MILGLALFALPFLALSTFFLARDALRSHRRGQAAGLVIGVIALEALAVASGVHQITYVTPANIDAREVPGTYVLLGRGARDEIVPGTTFHYREPNEAFCTSQGGGIGASLCRAGGQLALCLGDEGLEFIRR